MGVVKPGNHRMAAQVHEFCAGLATRSKSEEAPVASTFPSSTVMRFGKVRGRVGRDFSVVIDRLWDIESSDVFELDFGESNAGKAPAPSPAPAYLWASSSGGAQSGKFRWRRTMHHRVGIFDAHAVRTCVRLYNVHHCVIGFPLSPVPLPLEHDLDPGNRFGPRLFHAAHCGIMRPDIEVATEVFDHIHFVAVRNSLDRGKSYTNLRPESCEHDLLTT